MASASEMTPVSDVHEQLLRSPLGVSLGLVFVAAICCAPMIPGVEDALHVAPRDVALALGPFAVVLVAGAVIYHSARPGSRAYRLLDRFETVATQVAVLALVVASGHSDSFFWTLWIAHLALLGHYARDVAFTVGSFCVLGPATAVGLAIVSGRAGASALALVSASLGGFVYWVTLSSSRRLAAADAERARVAAELAELRVREERSRIAREIHDGLGTDLAAIDWRLRNLGRTGVDVETLLARLAHGSAELRAIVWAMRVPSRTWHELVGYIRERVIDVCGATSMRAELHDLGNAAADDDAYPGDLAVEFLRAVLELVYNAKQHARASSLSVTLGVSGRVFTAVVEDDGVGFPTGVPTGREGGLANLRSRIEASPEARLVVAARPGRGTRIELCLPASQRGRQT